jgi:F-type H+-transporting ATPase subunit b
MFIFQLIIVQVVTFIALVFVLRKLLFTEASSQVKRLKALNAENEKKQEELKKKIEGQEAEYNARIKKAEDDAGRVKEEAMKEIEAQRSQAQERAKEEAEKIISQARNNKEKMREEIRAELEEKATHFACSLVKEAFEEKTFENAHNELFSGVTGGLEQIDEKKISHKVTAAEITTAFPLGAQERDKIKKVLSTKAGRALELKEKEDKALIAGVIIKIGDLIIDGSLANRLEETRARMGKG